MLMAATAVKTFNATSADDASGSLCPQTEKFHFYVSPNAGSPVTLQESNDNGTTWVSNFDYVNGSPSTGKYVSATGVLTASAVFGSIYRLVALNADFSSGTTGTGQLWD